MKKGLFRKELVLGIIVFFIGVNIYPSSIVESNLSLHIKQKDPIVFILIKSGNGSNLHSDHQRFFGCHCLVNTNGNETIMCNISFDVKSYSLQGEFLGESSNFWNSTLTPDIQAHLCILPEYYGQIFTLVKATVEINNGEQIQSKIGFSIGKWIHFFSFLPEQII